MKHGIANDAYYAGCLARDLGDPDNAAFAPILSFCVAPYLSLFVHESYRKLAAIDSKVPSLLPNDVQSIVARSRHSLKLFEDTRRGVEGQLAYFRDELLPAHAERFLNVTWLKLARFLETDLGLFTYDKKLITSTHAATFHLGLEPRELFKKTGPEIQAIYEAYGRYFGYLGADLNVGGRTFVSSLSPYSFDRHPKDVRAHKYYRRVFDGPDNADLNALLTVFRGMMNFVNSIVVLDVTRGGVSYTPFKIRFLTLYQVLRSLQILYDEQLRALTTRSEQYIRRAIGSADARLVLTRSAKLFRNTLMHYNLDSRIDISQVNTSEPLFGLVPIYFSGHDSDSLASIVGNCIVDVAAILEEWARMR